MVSRSPTALPMPGLAPTSSAVAAQRRPNRGQGPGPVEATEQEINRLTWAVLDGDASIEDRRRLAELVGQQHALRKKKAQD